MMYFYSVKTFGMELFVSFFFSQEWLQIVHRYIMILKVYCKCSTFYLLKEIEIIIAHTLSLDDDIIMCDGQLLSHEMMIRVY